MMHSLTYHFTARDEATKESDLTYDDDADDYDEDNDWNGENEWTEEEPEGLEGDATGEGAAYIEFLNREVGSSQTP